MRIFSIILCNTLFASSIPSFAQKGNFINMPEHDDKQYYFGVTFGFNMSQFRLTFDDAFVNTDTFMYIIPKSSPGFSVGMMGNLRLSKYFDLRFIPTLAFLGKRLVYNKTTDPANEMDKTLESINVHLPLQLKLKSDRIRNFRFYAVGGTKFDYDLQANARSRRGNEFLKVNPADFGLELGFGFEWYYPNFIFSPELKISQGFSNQVFKGDNSIPLNNNIGILNTRTIVLSIHLEG